MQQSLYNIHLLITRPIEQARAWAEQLQGLGATTTLQPMLEIVPVDATYNRHNFEVIKQQILRLDEFQKIIFVSQNAVAHFIPWLDQYWPQLPIGLKFFAIGQATALQLTNGLKALDSVIGGQADSAMNSEALLALPILQTVKDERVAIVRGIGGRTLLGDKLSARGAQVHSIEVYERKAPVMTESSAIEAFIDDAAADGKIITAHSAETIENLCALTPKCLLAKLARFPLLVPGQRVCDYGRQRGFDTIITAHNATHESMIEALYGWQQQNG